MACCGSSWPSFRLSGLPWSRPALARHPNSTGRFTGLAPRRTMPRPALNWPLGRSGGGRIAARMTRASTHGRAATARQAWRGVLHRRGSQPWQPTWLGAVARAASGGPDGGPVGQDHGYHHGYELHAMSHFNQIDERGRHTSLRPIGILALEPRDFAERHGLSFDVDESESSTAALLETPGGNQYMLLRHFDAPLAGTEVLASELSKEPERDLGELLDALDLDPQLVIWKLGGGEARASELLAEE